MKDKILWFVLAGLGSFFFWVWWLSPLVGIAAGASDFVVFNNDGPFGNQVRLWRNLPSNMYLDWNDANWIGAAGAAQGGGPAGVAFAGPLYLCRVGFWPIVHLLLLCWFWVAGFSKKAGDWFGRGLLWVATFGGAGFGLLVLAVAPFLPYESRHTWLVAGFVVCSYLFLLAAPALLWVVDDVSDRT